MFKPTRKTRLFLSRFLFPNENYPFSLNFLWYVRKCCFSLPSNCHFTPSNRQLFDEILGSATVFSSFCDLVIYDVCDFLSHLHHVWLSQNHVWRHALSFLSFMAFLGCFPVFIPIFRRFRDITVLWCSLVVIYPFYWLDVFSCAFRTNI